MTVPRHLKQQCTIYVPGVPDAFGAVAEASSYTAACRIDQQQHMVKTPDGNLALSLARVTVGNVEVGVGYFVSLESETQRYRVMQTEERMGLACVVFEYVLHLG
jgi:hypothetical protein